MRRGLRPAVALRAVLVLGSLRSPAGKKPFIAHFDGGARYVARSGVGQLTPTIARARSSPFSAVKMGGPFSLRCLSPLCSPAVGVGQAYPLRVGMFQCGWGFCSTKGQREFDFTLAFAASHEACRRMAAFTIQLAGGSTRPASRGTRRATAVIPRPSRMSHEQPRALWRGVGCRGTTPARKGCRRAAVKTRPTGMSHEQPRAQRARCGVKGHCPL